MNMQEIKTKAAELFHQWCHTTKAFFKHPIQFTKDYFRNFKALSREEKGKKILGAAIFIAATCYAFYVVLALLACFLIITALLASAPIEASRAAHARWMAAEYGGSESDYL